MWLSMPLAIKECSQAGGSCYQGSVGHVCTHSDHHRALRHVEWERGNSGSCVGPASGGVTGVQWILQTSSSLNQPGQGDGGGEPFCFCPRPGSRTEGREVKTEMLGSRPGVQTHNLVLMFSFSKLEGAWSLG